MLKALLTGLRSSAYNRIALATLLAETGAGTMSSIIKLFKSEENLAAAGTFSLEVLLAPEHAGFWFITILVVRGASEFLHAKSVVTVEDRLRRLEALRQFEQA